MNLRGSRKFGYFLCATFSVILAIYFFSVLGGKMPIQPSKFFNEVCVHTTIKKNYGSHLEGFAVEIIEKEKSVKFPAVKSLVCRCVLRGAKETPGFVSPCEFLFGNDNFFFRKMCVEIESEGYHILNSEVDDEGFFVNYSGGEIRGLLSVVIMANEVENNEVTFSFKIEEKLQDS
jgi:hypothetical protein